MKEAQSWFEREAVGDTVAGLFNAPARMAVNFAGALAGLGSPSCRIPPPCWEPRPAGTCSLVVRPGCPATIRVHVTNCDWNRRVILITAAGRLAGWLTLEPTTLVIDAQEQATFLVTVRVPDHVSPGRTLSGPVLVRGCVDHYVRVQVRVDDCAERACCDVVIRDCPDHIHHWYDHFYCPRPCRSLRTQDVKHG